MGKCKIQSSICVMGCDRKIKNRIYLIFNNRLADMLMVNIFNYMQIKYTRHIHVVYLIHLVYLIHDTLIRYTQKYENSQNIKCFYSIHGHFPEYIF